MPDGSVCAFGCGFGTGLDFSPPPGLPGPPGLRSLPCPTGRTTPGLRFAGGLETLVGDSPDPTRTSCDLYWSLRVTLSSFVNLMRAFLSFFLAYSTVGPIRTVTLPFVCCCRCATNSVLNTQEITGSPSSFARVLMANQSSRRLDKPTEVTVVKGILRSSVVLGRPCTSWDIRMYIAPFVYEKSSVVLRV